MSVRPERRYDDPDLAARVLAAVSVDDPEAVAMYKIGDRLVFEVSGTSPASLRTTLDDLIACLGAAERTAGILKPTRR